MRSYFNIYKEEKINDLIIIFKSKIYEKDLNYIFVFFENLNKKLIRIKEFPTELSTLKKALEYYKKNNIYDYTEEKNYMKLFKSFYGKKEEIDFLLSKANKNIGYLYERIDPTDQTFTIKNIKNFKKCIEIFEKFRELDCFRIFEYIKTRADEDYKSLKSYLRDYSSIIELDRNDGSSFNLFENANYIIENTNLNFKQDNEDFYYGENKCMTNMEELIHLKNKIHIKSKKENNEIKILQIKWDKLVFFKENISNLEKIYDNMKVLRAKGNSLPI